MPQTTTLVIETSTPFASLALIRGEELVEQRAFSSDRNHNARLFAPLQELVAAAAGRIGRVLVGSGPGSYSGTRVGIAAAQGVAIAAGAPAIAVPSILAVPAAARGEACLAIGDARRGSFWGSRIEGFWMKEPPELTDGAGLHAWVAAAVDQALAVVSFEDSSRYGLEERLRERVLVQFPDAARLWQVWHRTDEETKERWSREIPQPMYLKPPHITAAKRPWLQQS